jgi:hypothetical protein
VAGLLVQNCLKYLLHFGQVTRYLGYNSLKDFFPSMDLKPNPGCANPLCSTRQQEWQVRGVASFCQKAMQLPPTAANCGYVFRWQLCAWLVQSTAS